MVTHTESFMSKLPATSDTTTGHHCQGASISEVSVLLPVRFGHTKVSQPNSTLPPRQAEFSLSVPKAQFRERGKRDKSPAGFTNGNGSQKDPLPAQHWNKVVYNQ